MDNAFRRGLDQYKLLKLYGLDQLSVRNFPPGLALHHAADSIRLTLAFIGGIHE